MNTTIRFLTGGLATAAVASAVTLAGPAAFATDAPDRPCGLPAVPAVFQTVTHDPELRTVPAVTHDEWRWERTVSTDEFEFSRLVAAAHSESDWTRVVAGTTEYLWSHTVIDQAAVPAVPGTPEQGHEETVVVTPAVTVTMFEYVQQQTGHLRWERDGWNADKGDHDPGKGWVKTGNTREDVLTPAVTEQRWVVDQPATPGTPATDEVSHVETTWAASSPGAGWTGPSDSRTVGGGTETTTTTGDDVPAGDGWVRTATRVFPEVVDTVWALTAPDGYTPTGASRIHDVSTEQSEGTSATAPEGDGWTAITDSLVVVVEVPEHTEVVTPGYTEQVLVTPEVPATEPCVDGGDPVLAPPVDEGSGGTVAGPQTGGSAVVSAVQSGGSAQVSAAAADTATVLPATGNPVSPLLLATGFGALVAGSVLVRAGRRRQHR